MVVDASYAKVTLNFLLILVAAGLRFIAPIVFNLDLKHFFGLLLIGDVGVPFSVLA